MSTKNNLASLCSANYDRGHKDGVKHAMEIATMTMVVALNHAGGLGKKKITETVNDFFSMIHEFTDDGELGKIRLERECRQIIGDDLEFVWKE